DRLDGWAPVSLEDATRATGSDNLATSMVDAVANNAVGSVDAYWAYQDFTPDGMPRPLSQYQAGGDLGASYRRLAGSGPDTVPGRHFAEAGRRLGVNRSAWALHAGEAYVFQSIQTRLRREQGGLVTDEDEATPANLNPLRSDHAQ